MLLLIQTLCLMSNVGAPIIRPDHSLGGWKVGAVHSANKHYEERLIN